MADDSAQNDLVTQFCSITGIDEPRAKHYLEAAQWKIDIALSSFYEDDSMPVSNSSGSSPITVPAEPKPAAVAPPSKPVISTRSGSSRMKTLSDFNKSDSNSDEEPGQAFYAGGSEHSGQQLLGPSKGKKNADPIGALFEAARAHGAQVVEPGMEDMKKSKPKPFSGRAYGFGKPRVKINDPKGPSSKGPINVKSPTTTTPFSGSGFRLGSDSGSTPSEPSSSPAKSRRQIVPVSLKMWRNGFSVNDGPLREYMDPANRDFLRAVQQGQVPEELASLAHGGEVAVNMEDHRAEEYKGSSRPRVIPFSDQGHRLGAVEPRVVGQEQQQSQPPPAEGVDAAKLVEEAKKAIQFDDSKPTTQVQIRLADGTRLVAQLNQDHTVADVRRYIVTVRPSYEARPFTLMMTFPNRELTDENTTLKEANLLNSCIVQRCKPIESA